MLFPYIHFDESYKKTFSHYIEYVNVLEAVVFDCSSETPTKKAFQKKPFLCIRAAFKQIIISSSVVLFS